MRMREQLEAEENRLSPLACRSADSRGRLQEEEQCPFRTDFQRDRDRIIHSKAFRRLMHKTQVFLAPEGDHYRTRLTHTLEVTQIARTIAKTLNLNEDLTEAIALGHDLGHTPFGHNGEMILNKIHKPGFRHNEQSLRVVDYLENRGGKIGMNLTYEVRDGILKHTGAELPCTLEGEIVRISDRIAYINHDIDDAVRSGVIELSDLPEEAIRLFGDRHGDRISNMIENVCINSNGREHITMDEQHAKQLSELRSFMFQNVYKSSSVKKEEDLLKIETVLTSLYRYYQKRPEKLPEELYTLGEEQGMDTAVKDYIACMTDRYALREYHRIFVPESQIY